MAYIVIAFILGALFGTVFAVFALSLLYNSRTIDEQDEYTPFNPDGTPKHIVFNQDNT